MSKIEADFPGTEEQAQTDVVQGGDTEMKAVTSRNIRRLVPFFIAGTLTVTWVGLTVGYLLSTGTLPTMTGTPAGLSALVAGISTPLAVIWLVALAFQRTDPLLERRVAIARNLHKAISPVEAAEQRLAQLHKNLLKELQNIEAVADLAADRIGNLENRFQEQISNLFSATADTEARTISIRDLLERERGAVGSLAGELEERFKSLEDTVRLMAARIEGAGVYASEKTDAARIQIEGSITALTGAAKGLEDRLDRAGTGMSEKAGRVQDITVDVELRLQAVTDTVLNGMDRFRHDVEGLESRSAELSDHMTTQATVLKDLAELAAQESAQIEKSLRTHVGEVRTAANEALERTSDVSTLFADRAQAMSEQVIETVDRAKALLDEAGQALETHCQEALKTSEQMNSRTLATTEETGKAVQEHARQVDQVLADGLERARQALEASMTAMRGHSGDAVQEAENVAERTLHHIRQLRAGVEEQLEQLATAGADAGTSLEISAERIGVRAQELGEQARGSRDDLEAVRAKMDAQSDQLSTVLNETRMRLARLEEDLSSQRDALTAASNQAAETVIEAAERFARQSVVLKETADQNKTDLETHSGEIVALITRLGKTGDESTGKLTGASRLLAEQSASLKADLEDSSEALGAAAEAFAGERRRIQDESDLVVTRLNNASDGMSAEVERFTESSMNAATRLDAATQALMDQTQQVQDSLHRTVEDTRTELAASMDDMGDKASERITYLKEEMQATLARVLSEYQQSADQAEKESALLAMRLGMEAEKIAQRAEQFIGKTAEIEKRIASATKNDFARTSQLLMESLQSLSIDINKALSYDLPDDVWESYMAGDRSVFMRRTLKMADRRTKKTIAEKFRGDHEFREVVGRYCRDFEGMMERAMLGDRGSALSVTLVSSDMGKLYVLLAQSLKKFG